MGIFDFFRRRAKRYATVIALIGALSSFAKEAAASPVLNTIPPGRIVTYTDRVPALGAQIQKDLEMGVIDKSKIREFARLVSKLRDDTDLRWKRVAVPLDLMEGILSLSWFYTNVDIHIGNIDDIDSLPPEKRLEKMDYIWHRLGEVIESLKDAEFQLDISLPEEKEELKKSIEKAKNKSLQIGIDLDKHPKAKEVLHTYEYLKRIKVL